MEESLMSPVDLMKKKSKLKQCNHLNKKVQVVTFLPPEIITEILSRLPGSTLMKFRLVCKLWLSLTYDSSFIALHLDRVTNIDPRSIIIFSKDIHGPVQQHINITVLDALTWIKSKTKLSMDFDFVHETPPCNGLFCLFDRDRNISILNPTTQELLRLPKPRGSRKAYFDKLPKCFFGYHPTTKEYKVVRFFYLRENINFQTHIIGCEVFTIGRSSWRYIGNIHHILWGQGINVDGFIYWMKGNRLLDHCEITTFDLKDEKFMEISPPDFSSCKIEDHDRLFIVKLEGKLCLVNSPLHGPGVMNVWMLMNHERNQWIQRCRISFNNNNYYFGRHEPILIYKDKILIRWLQNISIYDIQSEGEIFEQVYNDDSMVDDTVHAFVESLVSLRNYQ